LTEATYHGVVSKNGNSYKVNIPANIVGEMDLEIGSKIVVRLSLPKTMKVREEEE